MSMTQCQTHGCLGPVERETVGGHRLCRRCYLSQARRALQDLPPLDPRDTACPGCGRLVPFRVPTHAAVTVDGDQRRWHVPCYLRHLDSTQSAVSRSDVRCGSIDVPLVVEDPGPPDGTVVPAQTDAAVAPVADPAELEKYVAISTLGETSYRYLAFLPGAQLGFTLLQARRATLTGVPVARYVVRFDAPDSDAVRQGSAVLRAWLKDRNLVIHGQYGAGSDSFILPCSKIQEDRFRFSPGMAVWWTEFPMPERGEEIAWDSPSTGPVAEPKKGAPPVAPESVEFSGDQLRKWGVDPARPTNFLLTVIAPDGQQCEIPNLLVEDVFTDVYRVPWPQDFSCEHGTGTYRMVVQVDSTDGTSREKVAEFNVGFVATPAKSSTPTRETAASVAEKLMASGRIRSSSTGAVGHEIARHRAEQYAKIVTERLNRGDFCPQTLAMLNVVMQQFRRAVQACERAGVSTVTARRSFWFFEKSLKSAHGARVNLARLAYEQFEIAKARALEFLRAIDRQDPDTFAGTVQAIKAKFDAAKTTAVDAELNLSFIHDAERLFEQHLAALDARPAASTADVAARG